MPLLFFARRHGKMRYLSTLLVKKCLILCLCGAVSVPLCRGDWPVISPSNRAEHLLIHRIQSHTNPKRRKGFLKQAGQKSVKEEPPKQRKGPKRTEKCRLKVATHIWEQDVGSSSLPSRTTPSEIDNFRGVCSLSIAAQVVSLSFLIYLFYSSCAKRKIIIRIIRLSSILIHMRMPSNQLSNLTFCTESIEQICRQACSIAI